ncbi:hypothetical protein VD659_14985 [Herbiconiux sp. 11R-BC]|uniref:hypothetical protein n=1 Tax=Herbiconiux sp. 11R-BC TaxID=3111637 RepID=UPI003C126235
MDHVSALPGGTAYVASFVEVWDWGIVVRMVGLAEGFVRQVLDLQLDLRDDRGGRYEWRAATSGGMVLPEEVTLAFDGRPSESARSLQLMVGGSGDVLMVAIIPEFVGDDGTGAP